MNKNLIIATCQFPVSADISKNKTYIKKLLYQSKEKGAKIVHFSESSLSGYAGIDFETLEHFDETHLQKSLEEICRHCANLNIWSIVGSHKYGQNKKPYNCLLVINGKGDIIDRYDKRLLTGAAGELEHYFYRPGKKFIQFKINKIVCGLLICHEWRYPELYREHKKNGTEILFQSWYDGNLSIKDYNNEGKELGSLITGTVRGNAANNSLWISASNTSKRESSFASFLVRPDGKIVHQLKRNITGVLISAINIKEQFEDLSRINREKIFYGKFRADK